MGNASPPRGGWQGSVYAGQQGTGPYAEKHSEKESEPPRQGPSTLWLVLGCAAVVVLLIAVIFAAYSLLAQGEQKRRSAQPPPPAPSQERPRGYPSPTVKVSVPPAKPLPDFAGERSQAVGRVTDKKSGISYAQFGQPWESGTGVFPEFVDGEVFVTEMGPSFGKYWASILSTPLPNKVRGYCAGHGSLATVATAAAKMYLSRYYPDVEDKTVIVSEKTEVDGHRIYLLGYEISFEPEPGMEASKETVVIATIDGERKWPAILYASIPNTHYQMRADINAVYESVKVLKPGKNKQRDKKPGRATKSNPQPSPTGTGGDDSCFGPTPQNNPDILA